MRTRSPAINRTRQLVVRLLVGAALVLLAASAVAAPKVYGIELVPWSKEIEPDRYQSSRDWRGTLKYFKKKFAGWKYIRWHAEVNLPSVKYVHIENTYPKRQFDGINIYELPGGRVRIYMLKHVEPEEPKTEPAAAAKAEGAPKSAGAKKGAAKASDAKTPAEAADKKAKPKSEG